MAEFSLEEAYGKRQAAGADEFSIDAAYGKEAEPAGPTGVWDETVRGFKRRGAQMAEFAGQVVHQPARAVDALTSLVTGEDESTLGDWTKRRFVDPNVATQQANTPRPGEERSFAGRVGEGVGALGADLPAMVVSAPGRVAGAAYEVGKPLAQVIRELFGQGMRTMAVPSAVTGGTRASDLDRQGVDPVTAIVAGATQGLFQDVTGAAPLSIPGGVGLRALSGAGLGVAGMEADRQMQNELLSRYPSLQTEFDGEGTAAAAVPSAILAALFGPRAGPALRPPRVAPIDFGEPEVTPAQLAAQYERYSGILKANGIDSPNDPRAPDAIKSLQAREQMPSRQARQTDLTRADEAEIRAEVERGDRAPEQTPWAGQEPEAVGARPVETGPVQPRIIAGDEPGMAYRETPGNEQGRVRTETLSDELTDAQVRSRYEDAGVDPDAAKRAFERGRQFGADDSPAPRPGPEVPERTQQVDPTDVGRRSIRDVAADQLRKIESTAGALRRYQDEGAITKEQTKQLASLEAQAERLRTTIAEAQAKLDRTAAARPGAGETLPRAEREQRAAQRGPEIPRQEAPPRPVEVDSLQGSPLPRVEPAVAQPVRGTQGTVPQDVPRGTVPADAPKPEMQGTPKNRLLKIIKELGGIKSDAALDLVGEKGFVANRRVPGLFKKAGKGLDEIVEALNERGWFKPGEMEDVDGGVQRVRDMIGAEFRDEPVYKPGEEERFAQAADEAATDAWYADHDPLDVGALLTRYDIEEPTVGEALDHDAIAKAREMDDAAVEAIPDQLSDEAYMQRIEEILNGEPKTEVDNRGVEGRQEPAEEKVLEAYGREDLEARDAERRAAERAEREKQADLKKKEQEEIERKNYTLTGSDRAADANPNQKDLLGRQEPAMGEEPRLDDAPEPTMKGEEPDVGGKDEPKMGGGTELYGGIPLKPMIDALQKAWGVAPGYAKEWADNLSGMFRDANESSAPLWKRAVYLPQALLRASESELRQLGSVYGSKDGYKMLADMLFEQPGKARAEHPAFEPERRRIYNKRMGALTQAMEGIKALGDKQIAAQLDSGNLLHPAAKKLAEMLKAHGEYLKEHGALEDVVKDGYFPGMPDHDKIVARQAAFLKDAEQAMRMSGADNPKKAAEAWVLAIRKGEADIGEGASEFTVPVASGLPSHLKHRTLSKAARAMLRENGWYKSDVYDVMTSYLWRTTTAAEMMRTLGQMEKDKATGKVEWKPTHWEAAKKKILADGGDAGLADAVGIMSRVFGVNQKAPLKATRIAVGFNKALIPFALLGRAAMSSIVEPSVAAARAGKPEKSVKAIADAFKVMANAESQQEKIQFARSIGALSSALDASVQMSRMGADNTPGTKWMDAVTARYFTLTGLHPYFEASKVVSADFGRIFLADHAAQVVGKSSQQKTSRHFLAELVPPSKVDAFAKWLNDMDTGKVPLDKAWANKEMTEAYQRGVMKFVNESSLSPGRAERPTWASTPIGGVIYELTSYTQAFYKNVVARTGNLAAQGAKRAKAGDLNAREAWMLAAPAVGAALLMPMQYMQYELRDLLFADKNRKEKTEWEKLVRAFSGAGYMGVMDRMLNIATNVRYGTDAATTLAGPTAGMVSKAASAAFDKDAKDETNNTRERKRADMFYQMIVQPAAGIALSAAPGGKMATPALALATQVVTSPKTKEAFTSVVAGEKKVKKPKEDRVF